ncbi:membrane protein [Oceanicola sp. 22II-s10i]|uniref:MAPEG family protein n=1 Tax=Oceanicola sp. 22II-s10i TaxID=1317116 RepID=UPI000B521270|nr:MAPEG family protein [Oceanicola sp. 22II-s10i]OWU85405.1 membrane protein [Oceanicola sp. 22II-s10i]
MTPELAALAATALIHAVVMFLAQKHLTQDVGPEGNASPRDNLPPLSTSTERLRRALNNHTENIGLFISAVVIVQLTGQNSWFTATCAWVYVAARAVYVPAYLYGWAPWRSLIFTVGFVATFAMIAAAFF